MSEKVEVALQVKALRAQTPEEALRKARVVAEMLLAAWPGQGKEFRLTETETEPTEEARWDVVTMGGERILRGADLWQCRLTYQAEVEITEQETYR